MNGIKDFSDEDPIMISDIDEIPNQKNLIIKIRYQFLCKECFVIN